MPKLMTMPISTRKWGYNGKERKGELGESCIDFYHFTSRAVTRRVPITTVLLLNSSLNMITFICV